MKITKLFMTLVLLAGFTFSSMANNEPVKKSVRTEITDILNKSNLEIKKDERIFINFLVNNDNEIIIVSTSDSESGGAVKIALNQRKIESTDIQLNKVYSLPIQLKKM